MPRACIAIGSNVGDRPAHIELARRSLDALPGTKLLAFSTPHATAPVSHIPQGEFLNAAAVIETELEPDELLRELAKVEAAAGRTPPRERARWGPRTLDLDILLYEDRVIDQPNLKVPHPRMHERLFVLDPLVEIAPDWLHPVFNKTVRALWETLKTDA